MGSTSSLSLNLAPGAPVNLRTSRRQEHRNLQLLLSNSYPEDIAPVVELWSVSATALRVTGLTSPETRVFLSAPYAHFSPGARPGEKPQPTTFQGLDARGSNLRGARLNEVQFLACDLRFADLRGTELNGVVFDENSKLQGAIYDDQTRVTGPDAEALTRRLKESGCHAEKPWWGNYWDVPENCTFEGAQLSNTVFGEFHLYTGAFVGADLRQADLTSASFMVRANLRGARLEGAVLDGAIFKKGVDFADATCDQETKLPRAYYCGHGLVRTVPPKPEVSVPVSPSLTEPDPAPGEPPTSPTSPSEDGAKEEHPAPAPAPAKVVDPGRGG